MGKEIIKIIAKDIVVDDSPFSLENIARDPLQISEIAGFFGVADRVYGDGDWNVASSMFKRLMEFGKKGILSSMDGYQPVKLDPAEKIVILFFIKAANRLARCSSALHKYDEAAYFLKMTGSIAIRTGQELETINNLANLVFTHWYEALAKNYEENNPQEAIYILKHQVSSILNLIDWAWIASLDPAVATNLARKNETLRLIGFWNTLGVLCTTLAIIDQPNEKKHLEKAREAFQFTSLRSYPDLDEGEEDKDFYRRREPFKFTSLRSSLDFFKGKENKGFYKRYIALLNNLAYTFVVEGCSVASKDVLFLSDFEACLTKFNVTFSEALQLLKKSGYDELADFFRIENLCRSAQMMSLLALFRSRSMTLTRNYLAIENRTVNLLLANLPELDEFKKALNGKNILLQQRDFLDMASCLLEEVQGQWPEMEIDDRSSFWEAEKVFIQAGANL